MELPSFDMFFKIHSQKNAKTNDLNDIILNVLKNKYFFWSKQFLLHFLWKTETIVDVSLTMRAGA